MSLAIDTLMVGGATFLVGSVLKEISIKQDGEPVGWWPYAGTFIAGALGFYLLAATNVVKVKNAESFSRFCGDHPCYCPDCSSTTQCDACIIREVNAAEASAYEREFTPLIEMECPDCGHNDSLELSRKRHFHCSRCGSDFYDAESPTDDELESWSERQDDGSMLVTIDEDGESHTELTYKDGDLTDLKRFMAEVFEADRKARRRTTLTWTRGMEPSFYDKKTERNDGDIGWMKTPRPYDVHGYYGDGYYENDKAYHISGLPDGYHIHLWKPRDRRYSWSVFMKSPLEDNWKQDTASNKSWLMSKVLDWYNDDIATPEAKALTPVQELMISQGMISGDLKIQRVVPVPGQVQYFFEGGPQKHFPTKFATVQSGTDLSFNSGITIPSEVLNFCRGLIYIRGKAGNLRSVNRYNKDRKQWVKSQPAWFQNMCKQGIKRVEFGKGWDDTYTIMDIKFLRFYGTSALTAKKTVTNHQGVTLPRFQVADYSGEGDWKWTDVRPTTCRKMYDKLDTEDAVDGGFGDAIFNQCVEKYQPQKWNPIRFKMFEGKVIDNPDGWGYPQLAPAGQIMCRRFKKNLKLVN